MMKDAYSSKNLFTFLQKWLDKKTKVDLKIYDAINWEVNN